MAELIDVQNETETKRDQVSPEDALVAWVTARTGQWKIDRDSKNSQRWEEYYRLWRGIWAAEDKTRKSERSRLITPALQQAIESVTSEIESAILDKPSIFDMVDDDENSQDVALIRDQLKTDMDRADVETALNEIFLIGSIFGTGIGKLDVRDVEVGALSQSVAGAKVVTETRTQVKLLPVLPGSFIIDTAAKSIDEALGCAHEYTTPRHEVIGLQSEGVYRNNELKNSSKPLDPILSDDQMDMNADTVNIIDYQGKVPRELLDAAQPLAEGEEFVELFDNSDEAPVSAPVNVDEDDLVEAFVVIGNEGTLLKAVENPGIMQDRMFMSYRHEIVPDQFWGRGVAEKGYNSQKALDASMRARIDGLALTVHPMMGIDAGKMPKGFRFTVTPGRTIHTTGDPETILRPLRFGNIDPNVFTNNAELERMVQQSTGGMDSAAPVKVNGRNETAAGMSMQMGNFVKRAKRTIRNIEREFIIPMVRKMHRTYMLMEPDLYEARDVTYKVTSVLGTMARELEQAQYAVMLNTVEQGSAAHWMLMKSVYQTSSLSNREELLPLIDAKLQQSMQPPPTDPLIQLKRLEVEGKIRAEAARIQVEFIRANAEIARAANDARTATSEEAKNESQAILNLAKAEAQELGDNLSVYKAELEALERDAADQTQVQDVIQAALSPPDIAQQ